MVIVHGVDKQVFDRFRSYNLDSSQLFAFRDRKDGAVAGATIAKRKKWKVGQQIDLREQYGIIITICGIFFTGNEEMDNAVLTGFKYAQDSRDMRGWASLIYAKLRKGAKAEEVAARIDSLPLPVKTRSQPEKSFVSSMLEDLNDMIQISQVVIFITLAAVFAGIANTISMSVRDRTQQIGVMRTLGYRRRSILSLILTESVLISLFGGILGCLLVFTIFQLKEVTVQTRTFNFSISLGWSVAAMALGIAALVGLLGGLLPALRASKLNIVDSLRSVD